MNNIVFAVLFLYFRIYLYNQHVLTQLDSIPSNEWRQIALGSIYGFYALNIYWVSFILKGGLKIVASTPKDSILAEYILQYTLFIIFGFTIQTYHPHLVTKPYLWFDTIGRVLLSFSSFQYHKVIKLQLQQHYPSLMVNTLAEPVFQHYKNDVVCLILQSYLSLITAIFAFYSNTLSIILFIIGNTFLHGISGMAAINYLNYLKENNQPFFFIDTTKDKKYYIITTLTSFPIVISISFIAFSLKETQQQINILTFLYMSGLVRVLNIGRAYNHVLFHFCISLIFLFISNRFIS